MLITNRLQNPWLARARESHLFYPRSEAIPLTATFCSQIQVLSTARTTTQYSGARAHYRASGKKVKRVGCHYIAFLIPTKNDPASCQ